MSDFARALLVEGVEQRFHEDVERTFREAADQGASGKDISKRVLKTLADRNGPVIRFVQAAPGFTLPVLGAAIAYLLEKSPIIDRLLPGDSRPAVRTAKVLLKAAGGAAIIGALSGVRDAAATDAEIDRALNTAISNPGTPEANLTLTWDVVAVTHLMPGRAFPVARDSGAIRYDRDGVPVVNNRDWSQFKAIWDSIHKATTKQVGGGKGQPARTERVPAEPFPFGLLKLEDAIVQGYFDEATQADLEAIRAMFPGQPKEWTEEIGPEVRRLLLLISRSVRQGTLQQYILREDHIKDVIGSKSVAFLRDLAAFYNPRATADNRFLPEDLEDIVAAFDTLLGSELTSWSKIQRRVSQVWSGRASLPPFLRVCLYSAFGLLLFLNMATVALFLSSFAGIIAGALMPYEGPLTFFGTVYQEPKWLAASLMLTGAVVIIILLFTLRIWQRVLAPIFVGFFKAPAEYLAEFGWRFTFLLLPIFAFVIGAMLMESSITVRIVILAIAGMGISSGMGMKVAERFFAANELAYRSAKYGGIGILAILGLDWVIRAQWPQIAWGGITGAAKYVWPFLHSQYVGSALILVLVLFAGLWVLRRIYRTTTEGAFYRTIVQGRPPFLATLTVIALAIGLALAIPWLTRTRKEYDPLGADKPAVTSTITPEADPAPAPATPQPTASVHSHSHPGELDPGRLSPAGRAAYERE